MGEVWKARDTRLDRLVAIKQLKGQHTARFQQEARTIATLNHTHICQIYDVGPDYLVLEYVEGASAASSLQFTEVVRIDLIERRVARIPEISAISRPFPVLRSRLRGNRNRCRPNKSAASSILTGFFIAFRIRVGLG